MNKNFLLWTSIIILFILNFILFGIIYFAYNQVNIVKTQTSEILKNAQDQSSSTAISTSVFINETFTIPIHTIVPVNTTVNVPVTIPIIGQAVTLRVPIHTSVPVDVTVQVPIKKNIPINTKINTTAFSNVLEQLQILFSKN